MIMKRFSLIPILDRICVTGISQKKTKKKNQK